MNPVRSGAPPQRSWWSQNRAWILGSLAGVLALGLFVVGLMFWVLALLRDSTVTRLAVAYAKQDPVIQQKLGAPIELGWLINGKIQTSGSEGRARLALPIRGPKGKGVLFALASRERGEWRFSTLFMKIEGEDDPVDCAISREGRETALPTTRSALHPLRVIPRSIPTGNRRRSSGERRSLAGFRTRPYVGLIASEMPAAAANRQQPTQPFRFNTVTISSIAASVSSYGRMHVPAP